MIPKMISREFTSGNVTTVYDAGGPECRTVRDEPAALKLVAFAASPCPGHWAKREWRRTNTRIPEDRLLCSSRVPSI